MAIFQASVDQSSCLLASANQERPGSLEWLLIGLCGSPQPELDLNKPVPSLSQLLAQGGGWLVLELNLTSPASLNALTAHESNIHWVADPAECQSADNIPSLFYWALANAPSQY